MRCADVSPDHRLGRHEASEQDLDIERSQLGARPLAEGGQRPAERRRLTPCREVRHVPPEALVPEHDVREHHPRRPLAGRQDLEVRQRSRRGRDPLDRRVERRDAYIEVGSTPLS